MADANGDPEITSDFPLPPQYYLSIGEDGKGMEPPKQPADGVFVVFGEQRKIDEKTPSLEDQGLTTLFNPKAKRKDEVKKLVELAQERYLDIVKSLGENAEGTILETKIKDLDMCFINMIYLVNELRVEQAKASIKDLLKRQIEAKQDSIKLLEESRRKCRSEVEEAISQISKRTATKGTIVSEAGAEKDHGALEKRTEEVVDEAFKRFKGLS